MTLSSCTRTGVPLDSCDAGGADMMLDLGFGGGQLGWPVQGLGGFGG